MIAQSKSAYVIFIVRRIQTILHIASLQQSLLLEQHSRAKLQLYIHPPTCALESFQQTDVFPRMFVVASLANTLLTAYVVDQTWQL